MTHLDAIPFFLEVVKHASFAQAARELGVSRSAVNKRVVQLEEGLGVRLLHRTTRQVSLTEAGMNFHQHVNQAYYWLQKAEDAATSQQSQAIGTLKISAPMSFGRLVVAPIIPTFLEQFSGIQIDMTMSDDYVDIVAGGYDLAIRGGDLDDSSLIARKLIKSRSVVCASPLYFDSNARSVPSHPRELIQHNALTYRHTSETAEWVFAQGHEIESISVTGNYRVNNSEALLSATTQGLGIARLPDFIARPYLHSGELLQLLPQYVMPEKSIYALFPERDHMPIKLRVFLDFLTQKLASSAIS
ncbi:LysR family transcriptional regulator [Vibrio coralliilyticus]|uniref:LysR family transcriptional regulator n=1 Tax=Vibrio coralliilyticus TaxID=190893 RepID=UPI00148D8B3D|nr:LysR family transcriptional regulator [Vibrio coralliilyticus]NOI30436.1 LysR family transcriptional regulator [Vibrio coralliilyticus]NOI50024.1 LysR family transcriptional regulator [Vibrio coralliilyticus]